MRKSFFQSGGKYFLAFSVAAIVASVSAIGIIAYGEIHAQRREMAAEGNSYISGQVGAAMSLWLDDQVQFAAMLAHTPEVMEYCKSPLDADKRAVARDFLEHMHKILPYLTLINVMYYLQEGEDAFSLTIAGERRIIQNGMSLVDSIGGKSVGVGGYSFSYIKAVAEGSASFISEAKPNAIPTLPPVYMVTVPVRDEAGHLLAALGIGVKLEHFNRKFITDFHLGETGRLEILDDRGFFVGAPEPSKVLAEAYLHEGRNILTRLDPREDRRFSLTVDGDDYDYSASPVRVSHEMASTWWVVFHRSSGETHLELRGARNWLIFACSAAALFMILMAFRSNRAAEGEAQERARRKESELMKAFVDAAPYAVLFAEHDWRILDVNPAATTLFGYAQEEFLGENLDEFIVPQAGLFSETVRERPSGECAGKSKSGTILVFVYDICELAGGRHLVFFRDETELASQRKKTAELSRTLARSLRESEHLRMEAERANNAKSEFLANMSHEIRTPMNAVIGMAHLLLQQDMEDKLRVYVEKIQMAGRSLLGVINSVLDFSKIEAGKMSLENVPFDLSNVLERLSSMFQQPFVEKNLSLRISCDPTVPRGLVGDPLRLEQVITNLLSNALKFTEKGGVELDVALHEATASSVVLGFAVTDTGIGLSDEEAKRLFKAFSQADASTTRKYGGTGLGLVISQVLVGLMHGEITLSSTPGVGTTFRFNARFGVAPATDAQGGEAAAHVRDPVVFAGKRVLLVEDNPINQDVASELLAGVDLAVTLADNGKAAVDMLADPAHGFDIVLMDVQMPVMDGHEATRRARTFAHNADLPIIAMTAHAMSSERDRCIAAGMNDHLSKPIEVDMLYKTLELWLGRRAAAGR